MCFLHVPVSYYGSPSFSTRSSFIVRKKRESTEEAEYTYWSTGSFLPSVVGSGCTRHDVGIIFRHLYFN